MSFSRRLLTLAAPLSLLVAGGCATSFRADVARFQAMPVAQGQSFVVQAADPRNAGGIEFSQYAGLVSARLAGQGYRPADNPASANFVVKLDYGVDTGREKIVSSPGYGGFGYGGWGRPFGRFGYRSAFYYGWNDPFLFGGYNDVSSYTIFTSHLAMTIESAGDGRRLFEGTARARSTTDSLPSLVPNLVDAMFTNFPGRSGEEVRITIPPPPKNG